MTDAPNRNMPDAAESAAGPQVDVLRRFGDLAVDLVDDEVMDYAWS